MEANSWRWILCGVGMLVPYHRAETAKSRTINNARTHNTSKSDFRIVLPLKSTHAPLADIPFLECDSGSQATKQTPPSTTSTAKRSSIDRSRASTHTYIRHGHRNFLGPPHSPSSFDGNMLFYEDHIPVKSVVPRAALIQVRKNCSSHGDDWSCSSHHCLRSRLSLPSHLLCLTRVYYLSYVCQARTKKHLAVTIQPRSPVTTVPPRP